MSKKQKKELYRILAAALFFAAGMLTPERFFWPRLVLFVCAYLLVGLEVLKTAAIHIAHGQVFDENFLMSLATIGAWAIGEYSEAAAVMLFYQVGELFQSLAVGKSRRSIAALMDIRPDTANLLRDGEWVTVEPQSVRPGDLILIKPGEKVPLDGIVREGSSSLNTAALTGESLPRDVAPGDGVISGCVNGGGMLQVEVTRPFEESTVSRILDLVENASSKKAKTEAFITRFARWYTPAVVIAAVLLALLPPIITGTGWSLWLSRALSFLVISCPCALVISVPLSFFGGIGGASKCGILVKGSSHLEDLAAADTVVFDKTGTLTRGSFSVTAIHPDNFESKELLRLAALAECYSDHPISLSLRAAYKDELDDSKVSRVNEIAGCGVRAEVDGHAVLVGNEKLMKLNDIPITLHDSCTGALVHVAIDGRYAGHIRISDQVKPESSQAIALLRKAGVQKTVMLTGDSREVGEAVAAELGLDEVCAELLPQNKVEQVEQLLSRQTSGKKLVFVGDGINDAPVLARADVGVAMGALGSDAAIEAADIVLMDDDPRKLAAAIRIARKTLRLVKENIIFALGVKLLTLLLVTVGVASMWEAVFADVGVAVIAILNAMRAMRVEQK